jgi:histidinol dehydrogenase
MICDIGSGKAESVLRGIERQRSEASTQAFRVADEAIAGVRARGDAFVAEQIAKFDRVEIRPQEIRMAVPSAPLFAGGDGRLREAIETSIARVESFHLAQKPAGYTWSIADTTIEHRVRPLRRAGIYVPGGRAVYLSTLIMCAVPARIAGVSEIVVATPPGAASRPELLATCARLGIAEIYRCGGAAGIAALALGTESLRRVDKIAGPGNSFVTAAKARLIGEVGIDMTAGPTELVVIADETCHEEAVVADLMAQAEHGPDSAVICVATTRDLARRIETAFERAFVFIGTIDQAVALANRVAPEHLSIHTKDAGAVAARAENCGAIYAGGASAPAMGDYVMGSNHVLPTAGTARFFSPLGVYDFVKRTNVITAGAADAEAVAPLANELAAFEGLPQHGRSAMVRA